MPDSTNKPSPIFQAVEDGDIDTLSRLLAAGEDVLARNAAKQTPLHLAARRGRLKVIEVLLRNGADIAARDDFGQTPLHLAIRFATLPSVKVLVNNGADIAARDANGQTPLHGASATAARFLIERGADVHARDDRGYTALMRAAEQQGYSDTIQILLDRGANGEITNEWGGTALHIAVGRADQQSVRKLLANGPNIVRDLQSAFMKNNFKEVKRLLAFTGDREKMDAAFDAALERQDYATAQMINRSGGGYAWADGDGRCPICFEEYDLVTAHRHFLYLENRTDDVYEHSKAIPSSQQLLEKLVQQMVRNQENLEQKGIWRAPKLVQAIWEVQQDDFPDIEEEDVQYLDFDRLLRQLELPLPKDKVRMGWDTGSAFGASYCTCWFTANPVAAGNAIVTAMADAEAWVVAQCSNEVVNETDDKNG